MLVRDLRYIWLGNDWKWYRFEFNKSFIWFLREKLKVFLQILKHFLCQEFYKLYKILQATQHLNAPNLQITTTHIKPIFFVYLFSLNLDESEEENIDVGH